MVALIAYLIAERAAQLLPARLAERIARALARMVFALRPRSRRVLEENLGRVLGLPAKLRRREACAAFENFALNLLDFLRLGRMDPAALSRSAEVHGWHHVERARASGRGLILLSAHLGNWEWGAAFLAARGIPVHVLARPHPARSVDRFFNGRRGGRGVRVFEGTPVWPRVSRLLRRQGCVALMGDRPRRPGEGGHHPWRWAAALARRTGARLLPGVMVRGRDGRYAVYVEAPLSPEDCRRGEWRRIFERYARRFPEQWFAFEPWPDAEPAAGKDG